MKERKQDKTFKIGQEEPIFSKEKKETSCHKYSERRYLELFCENEFSVGISNTDVPYTGPTSSPMLFLQFTEYLLRPLWRTYGPCNE